MEYSNKIERSLHLNMYYKQYFL